MRGTFRSFVVFGAILAAGCGTEYVPGEEDQEEARSVLPRQPINWGKADGTGCAGFCGKKAPSGCYCDSLCAKYGDCCADKVQQCDGKQPSCQGSCGKRSADGCWCDLRCAKYGDCCPDKVAVCDGSSDPCQGVSCNSPPAPLCADQTTLRSFGSAGQCKAGVCSYASSDSACAHGCLAGACAADPCGGITCQTPPAPSCLDGKTLRTHAASGACQAGACVYSHTDTICADGCSGGACLPFSCSWASAFAGLYGQPWNPGDLGFVTSDGAVTRGLGNLDIAAMKTTASPSSIRVKGNPKPVIEVRLLGTGVYQVLAARNGKYLVGLGHAMWAEAALGAAGQTEQTLLRQFTMEEPSLAQAVGYLRLLIELMDGSVPEGDRAGYRDAAQKLLYKMEAGQLKPIIGEPHNHYIEQGGGKSFEFQLSLSHGRDAELGLWPIDKSWSWQWKGWPIAPRCNGCASTSFAGKHYLHCQTTLSWAGAQTACQARGGNLAGIENPLQGALARSLYPAGSPWIGLGDQSTEGTFTWISGAPVSYLAWAPNEPNDSQGAEDCVHVYDTSNKPTWNDYPCGNVQPYLCELP